MFGKSKITLQNEIKYLENKIKRLEHDYHSIVKGYEKQIKQNEVNAYLENSAREEPVMIDFDKVNVWSIERIHKEGKNHTIVSVLQGVQSAAVSKEYNYYVNSDGHKRIIAAYEAHRAKKGKKS